MESEKSVFLSISEYFRYLEATPNSRNVIEGEAVLNAGHIIMCGSLGKSKRCIEVFGLCLQTSALSSDPHEIRGKIIIDGSSARISAFSCSCKAGLGGRCKHISALLLHCTRTDLLSLDNISSTDLKCWWKNKKNDAKSKYKALPLLRTPCLKDKVPRKLIIPAQDNEEIMNLLIAELSSSSIAIHKTRILHKGPNEDVTSLEISKKIVGNSENSVFMQNFYNFGSELNFRCPECINKYNELAMCDTLDVCVSTIMDRSRWEQERKYRVTGSRCYDLFTYSKNDWEEKCNTYFYPKHFSNIYTRHGIKYEPVARKVFERVSGFSIMKVGLIICRSEPWLAYSADGILMKNGEPYGLLEIKCPYKAKQASDVSLCKYLIEKNGEYELRRKHKYYAQVQLGMAILNLDICHFIVFFSNNDSFLEIKVPFDEEYTHNMLSFLKKRFIEKMLHHICTSEN